MKCFRLGFTRSAVAAAMLCATPTGAQNLHEDRSGHMYLAGFYGTVLDHEIDVNNPSAFDTFFDMEFDYTTGLAVGYAIGAMRAEFEASYRQDDITFEPSAVFAGDDEVQYVLLMFNLYYDMPIIENRLDAFIGAGAGAANIDLDLSPDISLTDPITSEVTTSDGGNEWTFAAQVMAGLALHVTPNVAVTGMYRGQLIDESDYDGFILDDEYIQSFEVGVRITF